MKLEPEYQDAFTAWQTENTPQTQGALLQAVDPILDQGINRFAAGMKGSPTMKSQAKQVAINAFKTYDPARGSMQTHLMHHLQRLQRLSAQERQIIHMPEQVSLDQMRTTEAVNALTDRLGRPPSDQELADYTGLSRQRLEYIRKGERPVAQGTITQQTEAGGGGFDPATRSLSPGDNSWLELVYDDMDSTNQYIMERAFGMHGHPETPPTEIAKQLKLSPGAVSQRMQMIQQYIDETEDLGMF